MLKIFVKRRSAAAARETFKIKKSLFGAGAEQKHISALAKLDPQAVVCITFMATYIYETVPESPDEKVRRFEIKQSMNDDPLTLDPNTGQRVRRIISGGIGIVTGARAQAIAAHTCRSGQCGCS